MWGGGREESPCRLSQSGAAQVPEHLSQSITSRMKNEGTGTKNLSMPKGRTVPKKLIILSIGKDVEHQEF